MIVEINLTDEQQTEAQRLCDKGIGKPPGEENRTIEELLRWRVNEYLRQTANIRLNSDRKKLTREQIDSIIKAK